MSKIPVFIESGKINNAGYTNRNFLTQPLIRMWKWQVKAKYGHFFGEHKPRGSNFFESIHISLSHFTYMVLKKIGVTPFALILTSTPVNLWYRLGTLFTAR